MLTGICCLYIRERWSLGHSLSHPLPSRTVLYSAVAELLLQTLEAAADLELARTS